MPTIAPRQINDGYAAAHEAARAGLEPVFVPLRYYADDRGWSLMNVLTGAMSASGQINVSVQYPGVVKAWHRHDRQTDFWLCVHGHLKVGVHREDGGQSWSIVVGEKNPGVLVIPPPLWHGAATVGPTPATLLYYVTEQYDPAAPDEHRRSWDSIEDFDWSTQHR